MSARSMSPRVTAARDEKRQSFIASLTVGN
jgi:hypothetical protein